LLPAAYYEASILTRKVVNPCKVNSPSSLCRLYKYPAINSYGPVTKPTLNGGIAAAEFYRNYEHLSLINEQELPIISQRQSELNYRIQVPKPGRYVLVLDYITDSSFSDAVFLSVNQADSQDPDGIILLYPCTYQMVCRGPIMDKESREKVFFIDVDEQTPFVINGDSINGVAIKSLTAIPYDEWTPDFIQPQPVCVMKNGACVEATFTLPPNSKKIEFEVDQEERVAVENIPEISTNGTKTIFINKDTTSVQFGGKAHEPGRYVIIVGYFQPNHPKFNIVYRLQTENQNYDGKFTLNHCPSTSGCRGIIQQDDGFAWFDIDDTFTFSFTNLNSYGVWLDYIILVPVEVYNDRLLNEDEFDQTTEFLKECGQDHFNVQLNASEFCKSSVFSLTAEYNVGALPCNCDIDGSKSFECEPFGGQCQCKPNIVGR
jgi:laminin alpha 3/5